MARKIINLVGQRFGKLLVTNQGQKNVSGKIYGEFYFGEIYELF